MKNIGIKRCTKNPLISPCDVTPTLPEFKVDGVFNCGVTKFNDEYILLCRVAESAISDDNNIVKVPIVEKNQGKDMLKIITLNKTDERYDFTDSRSVKFIDSKGKTKIEYLTSISHLRLARSKDGVNFAIDDIPFIFPNSDDEAFGIEDPRITKIDAEYYINYTAVSKNGVGASLIKTKDFVKFQRMGMIFLPDNKDVTIFPEKINGKYLAFNRPMPGSGIGNPDIWISESPDLVHWGSHKHFWGISNEDSWDNGRIGGGAVPFKTEKGWIKIYHAADKNDRYCLGVFLLDINNPLKVLKKSIVPLMEPITDYENYGFFGGVVFTCGCLFENNIVKIYYGAADDKVCLAEISIEDIYEHLGV